MILNVKNNVGINKDFTLSKEFIADLYMQDDVIVPIVEHMRHRVTHLWSNRLEMVNSW